MITASEHTHGIEFLVAQGATVLGVKQILCNVRFNPCEVRLNIKSSKKQAFLNFMIFSSLSMFGSICGEKDNFS